VVVIVVVMVRVRVMMRAASFVVVDGRIPFKDNGNMNMEAWNIYRYI
jgi:hypothetical protein